MTEHFYFRGHLCIAMELLSINLYELIKANGFVGFSTTLIRRFTNQMLQSLALMRHHKIVHCDLKPEVCNLESIRLCTDLLRGRMYSYDIPPRARSRSLTLEAVVSSMRKVGSSGGQGWLRTDVYSQYTHTSKVASTAHQKLFWA